MPRRVTLTDRQKDALLRLPTSQTDLLKHYTLSDEDLGHIRLRRRAHNRFGFALQLCVLRYPGRVLAPGELIPAEVIEFIGAQLGLGADDLVDYAAREETRHEHLAELRGALRLPHLLRTWCEGAEGMVVPRSRDGGVERGYRPSLRSRVPTHPHCPSRDIHDRAALCRGSRRCRATHRDEDRQSAAYADPRTVAGIARGDG